MRRCGWRLDEDIHIYGQQEPTLHVPLLRMIVEPGRAGGTRTRQVVDLTGVKGANRSRARLKLHGMRPEDVVFGLNPSEIMGLPGGTRSADPRAWVPAFADLLRDAYSNPDMDKNGIARQAVRVATVQLQIIVGSPNLAEFHNSTFDPNRVDHRRPPLDYSMAEKASSDMRALLRECKVQGALTEDERAWLAGEGPDPHPVHGETLVDARGRRDRTLLDILFPPNSEDAWSDANQIRKVLGEPYRGQTGGRNVEHRTRMFSAAVSDGYANRWNPRVLDGLYPAKAIRDQLNFASYGTWRELLSAARWSSRPAVCTGWPNTAWWRPTAARSVPGRQC